MRRSVRRAGQDHRAAHRAQGVGFGAEVNASHEKDLAALYSQVQPEDLIAYGLIPEFIGRLPLVGAVADLERESLLRILTEPRNALTKQYSTYFAMDDVDLEFTDDALEAVAELAMQRRTGARGLRAILDEVLLNVMYELPDREDVARCVVDEKVVRENVNPTLVPRKSKPVRQTRAAS